jgi:cellulose synthase/poly-beta-1,6-N-acetylglucosamine synthase-like glycosyltransferase
VSSVVSVFVTALSLIFLAWSLYNVPVVVAGVRSLWRSGQRRNRGRRAKGALPTVSVIVPAKNEARVVGRLLQALVDLNYPASKVEIIVVDDASRDGTGAICDGFAARYPQVRVVHRTESSTKAAALNVGLQSARGDIIATFDADSVPEPDALVQAAAYFEEPAVAAVQGRICSINAGQNMLTRFLSYECALRFELYMRGKDALRLFVGLAGTCQFVRRSALAAVGGWNAGCLAEDTELSLRLAEQDGVVRYAPEARTWEESPFNARSLVAQRTRWFRGYIETGVRFGRLLRRPNLRRFDAEMMLFGTAVLLLQVVNYGVAAWALWSPAAFATVVPALLVSLIMVVLVGSLGLALVGLARPMRVRNVLWLPFVYAYWGFQSFLVLYALGQVVLRRPQRWSKTVRSGVVSAGDSH